MKGVPSLRPKLIRAADDQVIERSLLELLVDGTGRAAQVIEHLPLDPTLVTRLRPAALLVPAVHIVAKHSGMPRAVHAHLRESA